MKANAEVVRTVTIVKRQYFSAEGIEVSDKYLAEDQIADEYYDLDIDEPTDEDTESEEVTSVEVSNVEFNTSTYYTIIKVVFEAAPDEAKELCACVVADIESAEYSCGEITEVDWREANIQEV